MIVKQRIGLKNGVNDRMTTSALNQPQVLLSFDDQPTSPELNLNLQVQECCSLVKKCKSLEQFKQAHAHILKLGLFWNSICASNLVVTCALEKWGNMDYACSIFRQMEDPGSFEFNSLMKGNVNDFNLEETIFLYDDMLKRGLRPDNYTYPIVLKACAGLGAVEEGMQIHGHVFKLGLEDDVFVQNSLINMYGKCGEGHNSCVAFEKMDQKSVASWSAIIAAHARLELWRECLRLCRDMMSEGCWRVEESILVSVLSACTHLGDLDFGRCIHGCLIRNMSGLNVIVGTSLIDMYVKCGSLEKGLVVFQKMGMRNKMSYSAMISGLALHGSAKEALRVFAEMLEEGLQPDDVVYVGVLSACSNAGLVNKGLRYFGRMKFEHGIEPTIQHYGCMVDLLGRAGMLKEAFELIKNMAMKPNDVLWRSLLSSSKIHQDLEIGMIAAGNLFPLNSHNASDYLLLSNMYAKAQRWEDVAKIRKAMASKGLIQVPGFSMVKVNGKIFKFVSQDRSHPQCEGVYEMLYQMEWQLKFDGYSPDTSQVLLDVDEVEKRQRLSAHSQKLAIAFALLHTADGAPIKTCSTNFKMELALVEITGEKKILKSYQVFFQLKTWNHAIPDNLKAQQNRSILFRAGTFMLMGHNQHESQACPSYYTQLDEIQRYNR
ncbi:E motif [Dillenia turbinata]|uniref:E motif n=1 Tax=Dillenia turbinata TaxID=194707 RepID=A0AAN8VRV4_9MAGN